MLLVVILLENVAASNEIIINPLSYTFALFMDVLFTYTYFYCLVFKMHSGCVRCSSRALVLHKIRQQLNLHQEPHPQAG